MVVQVLGGGILGGDADWPCVHHRVGDGRRLRCHTVVMARTCWSCLPYAVWSYAAWSIVNFVVITISDDGQRDGDGSAHDTSQDKIDT